MFKCSLYRFSLSAIFPVLFALQATAADKLDIYYKAAESKLSKLETSSRYIIGALQECLQLKIQDKGQAKKYEEVQDLAERIYKKCKDEKKYDLALAVAQQGFATEKKLSPVDSPSLLKHIFFIENTLCVRDSNAHSPQLYADTIPYYRMALQIGEKMKPVPREAAYGTKHQEAFLLTAIIKDYMSTLKAQHRDSELKTLQSRLDKMPVYTDGSKN